MIKGNIKMREWARTRLWLFFPIFIILVLFFFLLVCIILLVFSPTEMKKWRILIKKPAQMKDPLSIHPVIGTATPQFGCDASSRTVEPKM